MLLCDPTGDPKVSRQRPALWDRGWWWITSLSWGPHLFPICWDFLPKCPLFQLSCACLVDRSGLIYAFLDLYFTAILIMNFVVLNKKMTPVGFFNG